MKLAKEKIMNIQDKVDWIYSIGILEEEIKKSTVRILKLICLNIAEIKDNSTY